MSSPNQQDAPVWDFMQFLDPSSRAPGHGVDHQPPFGGPWGRPPPSGFGHPWGPRPRRHPGPGHPHHGSPGPWPHHGGPGSWPYHDGPSEQRPAPRDGQEPSEPPHVGRDEKAGASERTAANAEPVSDSDPAEVTPGEDGEDADAAPRSPGAAPRRHGRGCGRSFRGARGGCGPRAGRCQPRDDFSSGASPGWPALHGIITGMVTPLMRDLHDHAQRYAAGAFAPPGGTGSDASAAGHRDGDGDDAASFTPLLDVYNTRAAYVVHVALPGARKEDLGVAWDPDTARLRIAGVVHRPGDEAFLADLISAERRIGLFERHVPLPPARAGASDEGDRDAVDADNISAKMENGILVVVVPKLEKEWTQIRQVDIE